MTPARRDFPRTGTRVIQLSVGIRSRRGYGSRFDWGQAAGAGRAARAGAARRQRARGRPPARAREAARARARRETARLGLVLRARSLRQAPRVELRNARAAALRRCGRHRLRHDLRPEGLRLLAGLHRLRRVSERSLRREDLQGDGSRREVRLSADRDQRLGRRPDPGGRRLARGLRRDLLAERPGLGSDPPDQPDHGPVRWRSRLLAGDDRLRA